MRVLGLDVGKRRVGLAMSDVGGRIASALDTVDGRDRDAVFGVVKRLVADHGISEIVVGMPYRTDGKASESLDYCQQFAEELRRRLTVPVYGQDERYTTVLAHQAMKSLGADSRKRRESVDRVAAVLILQAFLDQRWAQPGNGDPEEWG